MVCLRPGLSTISRKSAGASYLTALLSPGRLFPPCLRASVPWRHGLPPVGILQTREVRGRLFPLSTLPAQNVPESRVVRISLPHGALNVQTVPLESRACFAQNVQAPQNYAISRHSFHPALHPALRRPCFYFSSFLPPVTSFILPFVVPASIFSSLLLLVAPFNVPFVVPSPSFRPQDAFLRLLYFRCRIRLVWTPSTVHPASSSDALASRRLL